MCDPRTIYIVWPWPNWIWPGNIFNSLMICQKIIPGRKWRLGQATTVLYCIVFPVHGPDIVRSDVEAITCDDMIMFLNTLGDRTLLFNPVVCQSVCDIWRCHHARQVVCGLWKAGVFPGSPHQDMWSTSILLCSFPKYPSDCVIIAMIPCAYIPANLLLKWARHLEMMTFSRKKTLFDNLWDSLVGNMPCIAKQALEEAGTPLLWCVLVTGGNCCTLNLFPLYVWWRLRDEMTTLKIFLVCN